MYGLWSQKIGSAKIMIARKKITTPLGRVLWNPKKYWLKGKIYRADSHFFGVDLDQKGLGVTPPPSSGVTDF